MSAFGRLFPADMHMSGDFILVVAGQVKPMHPLTGWKQAAFRNIDR